MMLLRPEGANIPSGLAGVSTKLQKKSFQTNVKIRTAKAAIAGRTSGRTIRQKIFHSDAPSTRAASINSDGSCAMKLRMKKTQNPVWNAP